MNTAKKVLVLPDAGPDNPFQYLMINVLRANGCSVFIGGKKRFFATFSSVRKYQPDFVYFDWIQSFVLGKTLIVTLLKITSFFLEIQYVTRIIKAPIVHTLHNIQNHVGRWIFLERLIYTYFLRKCHKIRVYSETTRDKVVSLFGIDKNKIFVIQDVPYHFDYPNKVTYKESREFLKLSENAFVYLFLGMVKPYKGIEYLVQAFIDMAGTEDYLVIAGMSDNPDYAQQIKKLIATHPRVIFNNTFIKKEEVQYYYNAANVIVLPFKNIEHSGSVDLAMSFAKPIITLKTPFLASTLGHQQELLFETPEELEQKLRLVKEKDLTSIGQNNFKMADNKDYENLLILFNG